MHMERIARSALIAAIYTSLCLLLAPFSYGPVQIRVSEALVLLPLFSFDAVIGVTVGCFLANLLGSTMAIDMVVGPLATLVAALLTWQVGRSSLPHKLFWAALPPVLVNALAIGAEITLFFTQGAASWPVFAWNACTVGLGQLVSCGLLGTALVRVIQKNKTLENLLVGTNAVPAQH